MRDCRCYANELLIFAKHVISDNHTFERTESNAGARSVPVQEVQLAGSPRKIDADLVRLREREKLKKPKERSC